MAPICSWTPEYYGGQSTLEGRPPEELQNWAGAISAKYGLPYSHLCKPCLSLFENERDVKPLGDPLETTLGQTVADMICSSEEGCHLCWLRLKQISDSDMKTLALDKSVKYGFRDGILFEYQRLNNAMPLGCTIFVFDETGRDAVKILSVQRRLESDAAGFQTTKVHTIPSSNNSYTSTKLIQLWLYDCDSRHESCTASREKSRSLPTRLIDLGCGDAITPRLCLTQKMDVNTRYVSLSHCWGRLEFLRLLKSNVDTMMDHINYGELSKTFRDAMEVTKRIGIRYIWIDSLCIIQDSPDDWNAEAKTMGKVYQNAYLNIAATKGADGNAGCFSSRNLMEVEPCRVEAKWHGKKEAYYCYAAEPREKLVDQSPLLSRAWVVQEVTLASRVLHFADGQMFWECLEHIANESYPDSLPRYSGKKQTVNLPRHDLNILGVNDPVLVPYNQWAQLVSQYSAAQLTYPWKDKFLAISGLARTLGEAEQYLAGLWREHLLEELCWVVVKSDTVKAVRYEEYIAPTWSWASINGPVIAHQLFQRHDRSLDAKVLQAFAEPLNNDPMGQIAKGFIQIEASVIRAKLSIRKEFRKTDFVFRGGRGVNIALDPKDPEAWQTRMFLGDALCNVVLDETDPHDGELMYCLCTKARGGSQCGLLLKPTPEKGQYTRCGYFAILHGENGEFPILFDRYRQDAQWTILDDPMRYESYIGQTSDGVHRFVVKIV